MCEATARRVLGVAAALLVAAPPLAARQTTQELQDRIEALTPEVERAAEEAQAARQRRAGPPETAATLVLDTLLVGPVRVVTIPEQRALALQVVGEALEHFGPWIDENPALEEQVITFQWSSDPVVIPVEGQHRRVESSRNRTRAFMVRQATTAIGSIASAAAAESGLRGWFAGPVAEPEVPAALYRVLATFPADVNRRCLDGEEGACLTALGLEMDDFPYDDWYTDEQRRQLIASLFDARTRARLEGTERGALIMRCVDGDLAVCDQVMDEYFYRSQGYAPLGHNDARPLLVYLALQAGGDGAWDRLVADPTMSATEALEAASGLTADELAREWRGWVLAQRPAVQADLGGSALATVLAILAFVAMATRSTKWRLG